MLLIDKLAIKELNTNFGFICESTEAMYHIQTPTTTNNWDICTISWPFIKITMAAAAPKHEDRIIARAEYPTYNFSKSSYNNL